MLTLLLAFTLTHSHAIERVQRRCGEMLDRAKQAGFGPHTLLPLLQGHRFVFENGRGDKGGRPLSEIECAALGLPFDRRWLPEDLTFHFSSTDGAGLRLSALASLDRVGERELRLDATMFGFMNILDVVEHVVNVRGIDTDRVINRAVVALLSKSMRASVPLLSVGRQWVTLLFHFFERKPGEWFVGHRIGVMLARYCAEDREGSLVMLSDEGRNVCMVELGQLRVPNVGPRPDPPEAQKGRIELRP